MVNKEKNYFATHVMPYIAGTIVGLATIYAVATHESDPKISVNTGNISNIEQGAIVNNGGYISTNIVGDSADIALPISPVKLTEGDLELIVGNDK